MGKSFIFGGDTNLSYDELRQKQKYAEQILARGASGQPRTAIQGANSAANSILGALMAKRAGAKLGEGREEATSAFQSLLGGGFGGQTQAAPVGQEPSQNVDTGGALGLIKKFEGFRETPYWDVNAQRAGYGSDTITNPDGTVRHVQKGDRVTREMADLDLQRRVNTEFVPIVQNAIGPEAFGALNEGQRAALTSIAYNYGKVPQSVARAVSSGDMNAAVKSINALGSHNGGINAKRRAEEAQIFAGGALPSGGQTGGVNPELMQAMANPYMSPEQKSVLGMLLQQQIKASQPISPMDQLQMERMQLQNEALRNPAEKPRNIVKGADGFQYYQDNGERVLPNVNPAEKPRNIVKGADGFQYYQDNGERVLPNVEAAPAEFGTAYNSLRQRAIDGGLEVGTPEFQQFMINGGGDPATFRALHMQAIGAGLVPGTPEYQDFMATRGAGLAASAKTTATNLANTATGEDAAFVKARGAVRGKEEGTAAANLSSMESKMQGLRDVVQQLGELGNSATYTTTGRVYDFARKELGMEPRDEAVARSKYIAMVDNQVLPLLRDTFGAAFTVQEGESLRATLGDPNKTPQEKQAVLDAFISQKERNISALQAQTGQAGDAGLVPQDTAVPDGVDPALWQVMTPEERALFQ